MSLALRVAYIYFLTSEQYGEKRRRGEIGRGEEITKLSEGETAAPEQSVGEDHPSTVFLA